MVEKLVQCPQRTKQMEFLTMIDNESAMVSQSTDVRSPYRCCQDYYS